MSEVSIKKKLIRAYAIAGKILGKTFKVYRPLILNDALSIQNYIVDQSAAFTLSSSFTSPQPEGYQKFIVYTNHKNIIPGDIFSDTNETFVIIWNRALEDVIAIKATDLVEIHSASWDTTNGLQTIRTRTAKNVPASVIGISSATDISLSNVKATAQSKRYEVRIWTKNSEIKQSDNIKLPNNTLLHVDGIIISEMCQILTCTEVG